MTTTKIEWTDRTWNPVTGCTKVSPGCDNCYAENIARRFAGGKAFPNGFDVTLRPEKLDEPLHWRKPARVFVNSMSDLFHDDIPDEFIAHVWAVMSATPKHTYQVLTKRHGRMRSLLSSQRFWLQVATTAIELGVDVGSTPTSRQAANVWLGVSVEDQKRADLRIPALLNTPAAVRFLSCEPLLGPVDLKSGWWDHDEPDLDWVIIGGESGPGARPLDLQWVRNLISDAHACDAAAFVKQLGSVFGPHKGGDMNTWPEDLRIREFPQAVQ